MRITVSDSIDLATVKIAKITAETTLDGILKLAAKKLQNQDDFEPAGTERLFISLKGGTRFADLEDADRTSTRATTSLWHLMVMPIFDPQMSTS